MILSFVFGVLALVTLVGALGVVTARTPFLSALFLILALFGVAGLYVLLEAGFLAMIQVLIYVGAIGVLILFTIMLTRGVMRHGELEGSSWRLALLVALGLFAVLVPFAYRPLWPVTHGAVLPPSGGWLKPTAEPSSTLASSPAVTANLATPDLPQSQPQTTGTPDGDVHIPGPIVMLGVSLTQSHLLAFELISAILLVALVGAVIIARE